MIQQSATKAERRAFAVTKLRNKRARDARLHAEHNTAQALSNMRSWTDASIRKAKGGDNVSYGSIACGNRRGGEHHHQREIDRRARQAEAKAEVKANA